jgi:hypothetical protein
MRWLLREEIVEGVTEIDPVTPSTIQPSYFLGDWKS